MKWTLALLLVVACDSSKDNKKASSDMSLDEMKEEASVEWAREQLPELDKKLASDDPGSASSTCAVIKPDMAAIKRADAKLAETLEKRCGRDLAVRSMTIAVERAEKDKFDCSSIPSFTKMIVKAGAESDPEVVKLNERVAAACPKR